MEEYKVYAHVAPNGKMYIGITKAKKPENRWGLSGNGYKNQILFWRAIQKCDWYIKGLNYQRSIKNVLVMVYVKRMIGKLEDMIDDAPSEKERRVLQQCVNKLEQ